MKPIKRIMAFAGVAAMGAVLTLATVDTADARKGGGFGSRGGQTFTAPPPTPTAPKAAQPITRSATTPATTSAAAQNRGGLFGGGLFGGGFGGALLRGLAIGGLVGLLMGHGLGGIAGLLGLLVQGALIAGLVFLALRLFANRRQPAAAGAPAGLARSGLNAPGSALGGLAGGSGGASSQTARPLPRETVNLTAPDFDAFERLLAEIQDTFSREDMDGLRMRTTPEVFGYLSEELKDNAARGLRNQVSEVKLLQGDLSEAWREGQMDYATVAMRYSMRDRMVNRTTGAPAPDSPAGPVETTEIWTFVRPRGGAWVLSAIQDT